MHELIIWAAIGPAFRVPWLALASAAQAPLAPLLRHKAFAGTRLGSLFFWAGLAIGSTLVTTLYARGV